MSMNQSDVFYGQEHWERLEMSAEDAVERVLEYACDVVGEGFDAMADRVEWPIRILAYKRRDVGGESCAQCIAESAIERALEGLDEEYADHDGDLTEPTAAIKSAALAFGRAVVGDYVSWTCEPSGDVEEFTREEIKEEQIKGAI